MGTPRRRRSDRAGRASMRSPGRPPVARREDRQRFWAAIARGLSSEDAAVEAVYRLRSASVGFVRVAGCRRSPRPRCRGVTCRSLSARRSRCCAPVGAGCARSRGWSAARPSTISRELRRNAATRSGGLEYRATTAQWHADRRARRPKPAKLAVNAELRRYVQDRLAGVVERPDGIAVRRPGGAVDRSASRSPQGPAVGASWSPEQIAAGCASSSPMMSRCGSRTRRSTSRCTCRAAARCGASSRPACGPGGRCASPEPAPAVAASSS